MKKLLMFALLLAAGLPNLVHAACGGTTTNAVRVLALDNNREYAQIYMNYNTDNDTYCTTMYLTGPRENKPTYGGLSYSYCAAGLNSSGNCAGNITRGSDQVVQTSSYQFGPIRINGNRGCVKAIGSLSFAIQGGSMRNAFGQTSWRCFRS